MIAKDFQINKNNYISEYHSIFRIKNKIKRYLLNAKLYLLELHDKFDQGWVNSKTFQGAI